MFFFGLTLQLVVLVVGALLAWEGWGWTVALASAYGGGVAVLNSGLLVWRWRRGLFDYHCDGQRHLGSFHRSMTERFFVVGIFLALGLGGLGLAPLPLLTGFIVGQLVWVIAVAARKTD